MITLEGEETINRMDSRIKEEVLTKEILAEGDHEIIIKEALLKITMTETKTICKEITIEIGLDHLDSTNLMDISSLEILAGAEEIKVRMVLLALDKVADRIK